jgi:hypothetical protein
MGKMFEDCAWLLGGRWNNLNNEAIVDFDGFARLAGQQGDPLLMMFPAQSEHSKFGQD